MDMRRRKRRSTVMKFSYIPDGIDGLVLTDMEYLKELDQNAAACSCF